MPMISELSAAPRILKMAARMATSRTIQTIRTQLPAVLVPRQRGEASREEQSQRNSTAVVARCTARPGRD